MARTFCAVLALTLGVAVAVVVPAERAVASAGPGSLFLHGAGAPDNPRSLTLDAAPPNDTTARYRDSSSLSSGGANRWQDAGTWSASTALSGVLTALGGFRGWLGLKNSDDQGTAFDVRVQVVKNATVVAETTARCVSGVTRNPALAKQLDIGFPGFDPVRFNGTTDVLAVRVAARIGTNPDGSKCPGHGNATGLRFYFDSTDRPAQLATTITTTDGGAMYVTHANFDDVTVLDPSTGAIIAAVPVGDQPIGIVADPPAHKVYVDNSLARTVSVIDTATTTVTRTIDLPGYSLELAISPDGARVYAAGWGVGQPVSVIDTTTDTVIDTLTAGLAGPQSLAVSPDGTRLYAVNTNCCASAGYLSVLDIPHGYTTLATIGLDQEPAGIAIAPDGSTVYVSNNGGASQGHTLAVIDTATYTTTTVVPVGINPYDGAVNPAGTRLYVPNTFFWAGGLHGTVSVLDTATNTVTATIDVGTTPNQLVVSHDGNRVYVANAQNDTITVIDTHTNSIADTWTNVGPDPYEMALVP